MSEAEENRIIRVVHGDLLKQNVEIIVNPWNRNILPYWLLTPQGVSGAILREAGKEPFRELSEVGALPLGGATLTGPGRINHLKGIIHVAVLDLLWRASEESIVESVRSAVEIINRLNFRSIAFPLLGAGVGGIVPERSYEVICEILKNTPTEADIRIVRYRQDTK